MRLRATQLRATLVVLPDIVALVPTIVCAAGGLALVAFSAPDAVTFRLRLATTLVVAAAVAILDDTAAMTVASSPTTLAVRRGFRELVLVASVAAWWSLTSAIAVLRSPHLPLAALAREAVVLTAVGVVAALAAERWSADGRGGTAGALAVIGWFALSLVPRVDRVPLPPDPTDPASAGPVLLLAVAAVAIAALLSRDRASVPLRKTYNST